MARFCLSIYQEDSSLIGIVKSWESLFKLIKPDLVIFDQSPSCMIASLNHHFLKWIIGTPFSIPRADFLPFGAYPIVSDINKNTDKFLEKENLFLQKVNYLLEELKLHQINKLNSLFEQMDKTFLSIIPEFDVYGIRQEVDYLSFPPQPKIKNLFNFNWPDNLDKKIFFYLQPFPGCETFLAALEEINLYAVIYSSSLKEEFQKKFKKHIFVDSAVDMNFVYQTAEVIIHLGGPNVGSKCILNGIPQIVFPSTVDHTLSTISLNKLGPVAIMKQNQSREYYIEKLKNIKTKIGLPIKKSSFNSSLLNGEAYLENVENLLNDFSIKKDI